jgi:hypothetical protein
VLGLLAVAGCGFEPVGTKPEEDSGPAPADPRRDARVDQATPLPVDAGVDLVVDAAGPELAADVPADDAADAASDQTSDGTPDLPADVAADMMPDQMIVPDVAPEALPGLLGDPCTQPTACLSGVCSDGVCCATACSGVCLSCNLPGSVGLCMVAPVGQDPRLEWPPTTRTTNANRILRNLRIGVLPGLPR